jgi:predicted ArsR family transcriptional regulator
MLKTTIDQPGQPNRPLMALGILQGYLKHPLWFLLTTILTLPRFKKQLPSDLPQDFVQFTALQTWMYKRLKDRVGQEKAYEIVRACVLPIGLALQQGNFRAVEAPRTFENLIAYQQRTSREGPTRWNEVDILEQSEHRYEFRVTKCAFHDLYAQLGMPELTRLMCEVDNAIFNSYLPEQVTFHRNGLGNRLADGAAACHFVLERHAPHPRSKEK